LPRCFRPYRAYPTVDTPGSVLRATRPVGPSCTLPRRLIVHLFGAGQRLLRRGQEAERSPGAVHADAEIVGSPIGGIPIIQPSGVVLLAGPVAVRAADVQKQSQRDRVREVEVRPPLLVGGELLVKGWPFRAGCRPCPGRCHFRRRRSEHHAAVDRIAQAILLHFVSVIAGCVDQQRHGEIVPRRPGCCWRCPQPGCRSLPFSSIRAPMQKWAPDAWE